MRARLTKNDRQALVLLTTLLILFIGYILLGRSKASEPTPLPTPISAALDTLQNGTTATTDNSVQSQDIQKDTLPIRTERYPGPPARQQYPKKLQPGATIDLNSADTLLLQRVPGIGVSFARRIYKYREILGGYYCVEQLQEVYGMDRERYDQIAPYMAIKTGVKPIYISLDSIARHPYLQYRHVRALRKILLDKDTLTWADIMSTGQFSKDDSLRLSPYIPEKATPTM